MGYFRIFYYITYILNFILRLLKRHGKQVLLFVCIAIFLVICMYNPKSNAAYLGDDSYYDPYYAITRQYDSICIDFIKRFDYYRNQLGVADRVQQVINAFNIRDYYIYYTPNNVNDFGLSSINGSPFKDEYIWVVFYTSNNNNLVINPSLYDNYYNINDNIREVTFDFAFSNGLLAINTIGNTLNFGNNKVGDTFFIPHSLFHYQNKYIYEYFVNNTSLQEINLMYEMDRKLANIDETLQQQQEYFEQEPSSEDFSTSDLPTNSGVTSPTDNGLNSFFNSFYNGFIAEPNYAQHTIRVPIPFTRQKV